MADATAQSITVDTPTGRFRLTAEDGAIIRATWTDDDDNEDGAEASVGASVGANVGARAENTVLAAAVSQLRAYFAGDRRDFDLPLRPSGGAFPQAPPTARASPPIAWARSP